VLDNLPLGRKIVLKNETTCAAPVGAGFPAKRPAQETH
jgi:hypothetical protein